MREVRRGGEGESAGPWWWGKKKARRAKKRRAHWDGSSRPGAVARASWQGL